MYSVNGFCFYFLFIISLTFFWFFFSFLKTNNMRYQENVSILFIQMWRRIIILTLLSPGCPLISFSYHAESWHEWACIWVSSHISVVSVLRPLSASCQWEKIALLWIRTKHLHTSGAVSCFGSVSLMSPLCEACEAVYHRHSYFIDFRGCGTGVVSCVKKMKDELLIELVRYHPVLYHLSQPECMDCSLKQDMEWNRRNESRW